MTDCTFPLLSHFPTLTVSNPEKKKVESHKDLVTGKGEASDKHKNGSCLQEDILFAKKNQKTKKNLHTEVSILFRSLSLMLT